MLKKHTFIYLNRHYFTMTNKKDRQWLKSKLNTLFDVIENIKHGYGSEALWLEAFGKEIIKEVNPDLTKVFFEEEEELKFKQDMENLIIKYHKNKVS